MAFAAVFIISINILVTRNEINLLSQARSSATPTPTKSSGFKPTIPPKPKQVVENYPTPGNYIKTPNVFCPPNNSMPAAPSFTANKISPKVLIISWGNDITYCNDSETLTLEDYATWVERLLEIGTIYQGYKGTNTQASVDINKVSHVRKYDDPIPQIDGVADYKKIFDDNNVCNMVNNGTIDEVWLGIGTGIGSADTPTFWESNMVGPADKIFFTNGNPIVNDNCNKGVNVTLWTSNNLGETDIYNSNRTLLPSMGWVLHSFGHRFERTLAHYLDNNEGYYDSDNPLHWPDPDGNDEFVQRYDGIGYTAPLPTGTRSCGNVHFTTNSFIFNAYDYYIKPATNTEQSYCENWNPQHSGSAIVADCWKWGCWQENYFAKWWFQSFPGRCNGMTKINGDPLPDWWRLIYLGDNYGYGSCQTPSTGISWPGYVADQAPDPQEHIWTDAKVPGSGDKLFVHITCSNQEGCGLSPNFSWYTKSAGGTWGQPDFTVTIDDCIVTGTAYDCVVKDLGVSNSSSEHKYVAAVSNYDIIACLNGVGCDSGVQPPTTTPTTTPTPTKTPTPIVSSPTPTPYGACPAGYLCGTNISCAPGYHAEGGILCGSNNPQYKSCLTCVLNASPTPIPTSAQTTGNKIVFVTSARYNGNLSDLAGADAKCQARANNSAGLKGKTFRAWLSKSSTNHAKYRIGNYKYVLPDGTKVADNKSDLIDGNLDHAINMDENKKPVTTYPKVWTGTLKNGTYSGYNCNKWSSSSSSAYGTIGNTGYLGSNWTQINLKASCNQSFRLYCFQL